MSDVRQCQIIMRARPTYSATEFLALDRAILPELCTAGSRRTENAPTCECAESSSSANCVCCVWRLQA